MYNKWSIIDYNRIYIWALLKVNNHPKSKTQRSLLPMLVYRFPYILITRNLYILVMALYCTEAAC